MTGKKINGTIVGKLLGLMFSDNENESANASRMLVKTLKADGIHPSMVRFVIKDCGDDSFMSEILQDNIALQDEIDQLNEQIEELCEVIEDLRSQPVRSEPSMTWDQFEQLSGGIVEPGRGWQSRMVAYLNSVRGFHPMVTINMMTNWRTGRTKMPDWIVDAVYADYMDVAV